MQLENARSRIRFFIFLFAHREIAYRSSLL